MSFRLLGTSLSSSSAVSTVLLSFVLGLLRVLSFLVGDLPLSASTDSSDLGTGSSVGSATSAVLSGLGVCVSSLSPASSTFSASFSLTCSFAVGFTTVLPAGAALDFLQAYLRLVVHSLPLYSLVSATLVAVTWN